MLKETEVQFTRFIEEMAFGKDAKGERYPTLGFCGIFRYDSMDTKNINYDEHEEYTKEGEEEFLKNLLIAFPEQVYENMEYHL